MNKIQKKIIYLLIGMLTSIPSLYGDSSNTFGHTFFSQRSQCSNLARRLVGTTPYLVPCDIDCLNGFLTFTPAYTRSFDRDEIGKFLFYNGTNKMTFGASEAPGVDVYAPNFFLNEQFFGTVTALPRVENALLDIQFRLNLDEWVCGLYFDVHAPITWTRWTVNLDENITSSGQSIPAGTFGNNTGAQPSPIGSILAAYNGQQLNTTLFPDLKQVLQFGRVDTTDAIANGPQASGRQTTARLADIEMALGYNFLCDEYYHVGVDIRTMLPTGNRPNSRFLFEPVAGNGNHFEVGAGASASYEFWNNCCDSAFRMWIETDIYTVLKTRQRRIFDLQNADGTHNVGSNRLLIKKFIQTGPDTAPIYADEILYGPNVLALNCKVRNSIHAEAVVLFDYYRCGFMLDVGYNLWARTQDKISNIEQILPNTFALQGDTLTFGPTENQTGSTARINGAGGAPDATQIFISNDQLFIGSAAHPTALSHKFFAHANYAWENCDYTPFLGIGGEVEFSGRNNAALDQWGLWIKGGFAFS